MERDLPALWRSPGWRAEVEAWFVPALEGAGRTVTGPLVQERVRSWSTVLHVETDAGRVWVKENAPSQRFEAALVEAVERIVPGLCAPLVAVDTERGWLATADLGLPMWHAETPPPEDDWVCGPCRWPTPAGRPTRRRPSSTTASGGSTTPRASCWRAACPAPSSTTTCTWPTPSGGPAAARRALAAGLEPWTDRWDHATLAALVPAADRISCLHRAESWSRLQGDVPVEVVEEDYVRGVVEWVVDAAAPDPYASGLPR